jgi:hypothetical protein
MKKIFSIITVTAMMVACNTKKDTAAEKAAIIAAYEDSVRKTVDTAGLSEFQNWKAQNELSDAELYNQSQVAAAAPVANKAVRTAAPARTSSASKNSTSNSNGGTMNSESSNTATRKTGWSKAAKGAAIGGASGAVVGAVVNKKNRVAGGVIGGVVGAGVGYGVGRAKDNKDGRN